jgi:tetratricopeptide (TPR) repeat protein
MKLPFINRKNELAEVETLIAGTKISTARFIQCNTQPASGLTSFLKQSTERLRKGKYSFYIDGNQKIPNSFVSQILVEMMKSYPSLCDSFKDYFLEKYPNDLRGKGTALLSLIPHVGSFAKDYLKESLEYGNLAHLQSMGYPSLIAEMMCPFLIKISEKRSVVILVDNAQELDSWSLELIETSISADVKSVSYIMGFVSRKNEENKNAENIFWKVSSLGINVASLYFPLPDKSLIREFCNYEGLNIPETDLFNFSKSSDNNIYKILSFVQNKGLVQATDNSLTKIHVEIIGYLDTASQPLRKSDIITLLSNANHFFISSIDEIENAITILVNKGYLEISELPDADILISLQSSSNPYVSRHLTSTPEKLIRARDIYDYFRIAGEDKSRHSATELALLLYRLSKLVDVSKTSKWGQAILSLSMRMGSIESAKRYVDKAVLEEPISTVQDYFVKIAFHISVRQYKEALGLLREPPKREWEDIRIFKILLAISYNRCRYHKESEQIILELISTTKHRTELSILLAYSISGHLHENNIEKARLVFTIYNNQVKGADNYGYFLRNAATAFDTGTTAALLKEALDSFMQNRDTFGYYSTLCNLGKTKCKLGLYGEAEVDLEKAYEQLKTFGFHHLHIVLNNLGICKILMNKPADAEIILNRALVFAHNSMPKAYNNINLALLKVYQNKAMEAWIIMTDLENEIRSFTFERVSQKFYLNYAFIAFATGRKDDEVSAIIQKSKSFPDRMSKEYTFSRLAHINEHLNNQRSYVPSMFLELADFCYLEYWYQNPLELLPEDLLPL